MIDGAHRNKANADGIGNVQSVDAAQRNKGDASQIQPISADQRKRISSGSAGETVLSGTLLDGLVAYWTLDETSGTRSSSVGSFDLTDNNTVTSGSGIQSTNAANFQSGNSEYLSRSDAGLDFEDEDFTLTAWVNIDTSTGTSMGVVSKFDGALADRAYRMYVDGSDGSFWFDVATANNASNSVTSDAFGALSGWYFMVAWHDKTANTINIQVNNGTPDSLSHTQGCRATAIDFQIGAFSNSGAAFFFDGLIDEVGIYSRVLTADERTALYNNGDGLTHP